MCAELEGEVAVAYFNCLLWHEKKHETPREDNRCPALDLNRVPPEYRSVSSLSMPDTKFQPVEA
jgi:hypothetical protein